ncbi:MAG TPA: hypothetical protein VFE42_20680 [Chloroflexota bacterium]|nr:hypothetical protein [Chloroflexota bacterium]HZS89894.1 hypothetical protein [Chloroflexota bacterium]
MDRVLLVCNDDAQESVAAFNHSYRVENGFCVVDVTPYRAGEPNADAALDAAEICRIVQTHDFGGARQSQFLFRPARKDEVEAFVQARESGQPPARPAAPAPAPTPAQVAAAAIGDPEAPSTLTSAGAPGASGKGKAADKGAG